MKKEIVAQSTSQESAPKMRGGRRPVATLLAVVALIVYASSSALATQCEVAEFNENGAHYPQTIYVYVTTATPGATIFATVGNHFIPQNPTHNGATPTGTTFICGGTFAVFAGDYKYIKAIVYKAGMTDSAQTEYYVDNTAN
ncbi:MAG TPA: hypothetical protein VGW39_16755 [Chthoniobacterales bacterium]|nr:hypothetical protein [Chthoniobacterales bacterium]